MHHILHRSSGPVDVEHFRTLLVESACEHAEEKLVSSWYPRVTALFNDPVLMRSDRGFKAGTEFYECVDTLLSNQLREVLTATIQHYMALFKEEDTTCLPVFKLQLCLEGQTMEFFPSLSELEAAILCPVDVVAAAVSTVPKTKVRVCTLLHTLMFL